MELMKLLGVGYALRYKYSKEFRSIMRKNEPTLYYIDAYKELYFDQIPDDQRLIKFLREIPYIEELSIVFYISHIGTKQQMSWTSTEEEDKKLSDKILRMNFEGFYTLKTYLQLLR